MGAAMRRYADTLDDATLARRIKALRGNADALERQAAEAREAAQVLEEVARDRETSAPTCGCKPGRPCYGSRR